MASIAATSVTLSGSVSSDSVVISYEIVWQKDTSVECPDEDEGMATSFGMITGLEEDSHYIITVTASNAAGSSNVTVNVMTLEAGESHDHYYMIVVLYNIPQLPLLLLLL